MQSSKCCIAYAHVFHAYSYRPNLEHLIFAVLQRQAVGLYNRPTTLGRLHVDFSIYAT